MNLLLIVVMVTIFTIMSYLMVLYAIIKISKDISLRTTSKKEGIMTIILLCGLILTATFGMWYIVPTHIEKIPLNSSSKIVITTTVEKNIYSISGNDTLLVENEILLSDTLIKYKPDSLYLTKNINKTIFNSDFNKYITKE